MGYEGPLREIDPTRAREEMVRSLFNTVEWKGAMSWTTLPCAFWKWGYTSTVVLGWMV